MHKASSRLRDLARVFRGQGGFSLVEIMVSGAILIIAGVGAYRMFADNNKQQRILDLDQRLNSFHATLTKVVQNVGTCNATFSVYYDTALAFDAPGAIYLPLNPDPKVYLTQNAGNTPMGAEYISQGKYIDEIDEFRNVSSRTWRLDVIEPLDPSGFSAGIPPSRRGLKITYSIDSTPQSQAKTVTKVIPLFMRFATDLKFKECYNPQGSTVSNTQKSLCYGMNTSEVLSDGTLASFDPDTQRCKLNTAPAGSSIKTCPVGMVIRGFNSDGEIKCVAAEEGAENVVPDTATITNCAPGKRMYIRKVGGKMIPSCE